MPAHRRRASRWPSRFVVALLLAVALPATGLPFAPEAGRTPLTGRTAAAEQWSYAESRDTLLPPLPESPAEAAIVLVDLIYGEDFEVASFATMELFRRAGLPLINLEGDVAALPDDLALVDAAVMGEFVPHLVRAVRAGDFYTLEELNFLLVDSGVFSEPLPAEALVAGLGRWGKGENDPAESSVAGAAVRALGAKRGDVYYSRADPALARLDPLQTLLIFSHIAVNAYRLEEPVGLSPLDALLGVGVARAQTAEGCVRALETFEKSGGDTLSAAAWEVFLAAMGNEGVSGPISDRKDLADKASAIVTTIMWLTGIRLPMKVAPTETHFRHSAGDKSRNVTVTATARFEYPYSKNGAACWKLLANIDIFPQGPLPGFKVRWTLNQPMTRAQTGKLLRPVAGQAQAFSDTGPGGDITDEKGESTVVLEPAVERRPDQGTATTEKAAVIASLDKADFPFALKDLLAGKNIGDLGKGKISPYKFAADKIIDLAHSAIRRLGLPKQQVIVPVEYHGRDILVIKGTTTLWAFYYFMPVYVDLFTCDGRNGEWHGIAGIKMDRTMLGDAANQVFGVDMPANETLDKELNFMLDLRGGFDRAVLYENMMELEIEIDEYAWKRGKTGRGRFGNWGVVGQAELTLRGSPAGPLAIFDSRRATFDVVRYSADQLANADEMCPGGESYFP